jgi:hypothetical protein
MAAKHQLEAKHTKNGQITRSEVLRIFIRYGHRLRASGTMERTAECQWKATR